MTEFGRAAEDIEAGGVGTVVLDDRPGVDERSDDGRGSGLSGWFCLEVKPFHCGGCGRRVRFFDDSEHQIVVWPSENDPNLVHVIEELADDDPRPVAYELSLGRCISFYALSPS